MIYVREVKAKMPRRIKHSERRGRKGAPIEGYGRDMLIYEKVIMKLNTMHSECSAIKINISLSEGREGEEQGCHLF